MDYEMFVRSEDGELLLCLREVLGRLAVRFPGEHDLLRQGADLRISVEGLMEVGK